MSNEVTIIPPGSDPDEIIGTGLTPWFLQFVVRRMHGLRQTAWARGRDAYRYTTTYQDPYKTWKDPIEVQRLHPDDRPGGANDKLRRKAITLALIKEMRQVLDRWEAEARK